MKTIVDSPTEESFPSLTLIIAILGAFLLFLNGIGLYNSLTDGGYITWQGVLMASMGLGVALSFLLSPMLKHISSYAGMVLGTGFLVANVAYNSHNAFITIYGLLFALILYLFPSVVLLYKARRRTLIR